MYYKIPLYTSGCLVLLYLVVSQFGIFTQYSRVPVLKSATEQTRRGYPKSLPGGSLLTGNRRTVIPVKAGIHCLATPYQRASRSKPLSKILRLPKGGFDAFVRTNRLLRQPQDVCRPRVYWQQTSKCTSTLGSGTGVSVAWSLSAPCFCTGGLPDICRSQNRSGRL